jgi:hypothetical protein
MATVFVDSRNGNDANSGVDFANALKTLGAGFLAAGAGGTINATGVFKETLTQAVGQTNTWNAVGFAVLDGDFVLSFGLIISSGGTSTQTFNGFVFKNHVSRGVFINNAVTNFIIMNDCVVEDEPTGIAAIFGTQFTLTRCIVRNCSVDGFFDHALGGSATKWNLLNCTIVNNGTGVHSDNASVVKAQNCIFSHNTIHIKVDAAGDVDGVQNFNNIDFSSGKCVIGGVDKTTLAAWQTDVATADSQSISADPTYVDRLKRLHGLKPASQSLVAGSLALGSIVQGAILKQCEGVSTNENSSEWTGATLVNVVINGNGELELDTGQDVGTATIVHNFGSPRDISRLFVEHDHDFAFSVLDFDKSDTLPETWEVRVATSDDGISFSAFTEVNLRQPDLAIVAKQYVKVEITLRRDAA